MDGDGGDDGSLLSFDGPDDVLDEMVEPMLEMPCVFMSSLMHVIGPLA